MDGERRRCALPGCTVEIQIAHGRPERRYCTAAHRAAARRARRAALHGQRHGVAAPAETLPWLRGLPTAAGADPGARVPAAATPGPAPRPVDRPVVHRAEPGAVSPAAARRSADRRREEARPRRRRALALLGLAGLLAGGYAATAGPGSPPVPAQARPDGGTTDAWAQQATVALAAVNDQLDTLARTEEQWQQLPESRSGGVPAPVTALQQRRAVLQQRRATLESQLASYRNLRAMQQELADSEQHLEVVEQALAEAAPQGGGPQEAAVAALDQQRDLRIRQRDAQRAQVAALEDGVAAAARAPMPDDGAVTARISDDVLAVVRDDGRAPQSSESPLPDPQLPDPASPRPAGPPDPPADPTAESPADLFAELHARAHEVAQEARHAARAGTAGPTRTTAPAVAREPAHRTAGHGPAPQDDEAIEEENLARSSAAQNSAAQDPAAQNSAAQNSAVQNPAVQNPAVQDGIRTVADRSTGRPPVPTAAATTPTRGTPGPAGRFDPHDGYLRLSRLLAGSASSP